MESARLVHREPDTILWFRDVSVFAKLMKYWLMELANVFQVFTESKVCVEHVLQTLTIALLWEAV